MPIGKVMLFPWVDDFWIDFPKNQNPHLPTNYFHFPNYGLYGHAKGNFSERGGACKR